MPYQQHLYNRYAVQLKNVENAYADRQFTNIEKYGQNKEM